jgi:FkbM family methyltransferase
VYSLLKTARPTLRKSLQRLVRSMAARRSSRQCLNFLYSALPEYEKARFHALCNALFVDGIERLEDGNWIVKFAGKRLILPLTAEGAWQEWDAAVAILGHDLEIKRTYAHLLRGRSPKLFFDVGANYGLHSLLFLVHGIRTVSFEPNVNCHPYLRRVCELNNLKCDIQPVALSDVEGVTELWFPEKQTWMGTTDAHTSESLGIQFALSRIQVEQTTIDKFVERYGCRPDLIKIDTEGNEVRVLKGARKTLKSSRPLLIFESWPGSRPDLSVILDEMRYRILPLPLRVGLPCPLDGREFIGHPAKNFLAFSAEHLAADSLLLCR